MNRERHPDYRPPECHETHEVLYEDAHIVVVNKPAGLLSVPGRHMKDSLLGRIRERHPQAAPAHRLDLDTSGLMVVPVSKTAMRDISAQFRERAVHKQYIADVAGVPHERCGKIELAIGPDWENRPRNRIDPENGKAALTYFEWVATNRSGTASRMSLHPVTGRSHQLRLHMLALGHAILGCDLYASEILYACVPRLHLHASELRFLHPEDQRPMAFQSRAPFALPDDVPPMSAS